MLSNDTSVKNIDNQDEHKPFTVYTISPLANAVIDHSEMGFTPQATQL